MGVQVTDLENIDRGERILEEGDREGHVPKWNLSAMEEKEEEGRFLCRVTCLWDLEEERRVSTSFCKSPKYKFSRKSIEWDVSSGMRKDGQIENRETRGT